MAIAAALKSVGLDDSDWDKAAAGLSLAALATHTTGAQVRGGVVDAIGDPLKVVAGSGLSMTVKAGPYLLPVSDPARGPLIVTLPADTTVTSETANGSNPRIDRVILEVSDDGDVTETTLAASASIGATSLSLTAPGAGEPALTTGFYVVGTETVQITALSGSGPYTATLGAALTAAHTSGDAISEAPFRVRIVKGVAGGSPAVPSTNWITPGGSSLSLGNGAWAPLGYVSIGTNATSLGAITDERVWTAAAGGRVKFASAAALTASPPPKGTPIYFLDTDTFGYTTSDAGAYQTVTKPNVVAVRKWIKSITVPAGLEYGVGDLRTSESLPGAYGSLSSSVATVIASSPYEQLVVGSTGLYDLEYKAYASGAHGLSYISLETEAAAFDNQGRASIVIVGIPLTAAQLLYPKITNGESTGQTYTTSFKVKRIQ